MGKNNQRGRALEAVVAALHSFKEAKVSQNIRLPHLLNPTKTREFDILVETESIGYEVKFLIECKNYNNPIGSPEIDKFVGKLKAVGFPTHQAIFVSRLGYKKGIVEYAKSLGIRTLSIEGLSNDGLSSILYQAFQSNIYYCCRIQEIIIFPTEPSEDLGHHLYSLFEEGSYVGNLSDMIWLSWHNGYPPTKAGVWELEININGKYHQLEKGKKIPIDKVVAFLEVSANVVTFEGSGNFHKLLKAENMAIEKFHGTMKFEKQVGDFPVLNFKTEQELSNYVKSKGGMHIQNLVRLNKIDVGTCYWPPSSNALKQIEVLTKPFLEGEVSEKPMITTGQTEGQKLNAFADGIDESWLKYYRETIFGRGMEINFTNDNADGKSKASFSKS